MTPRTSFVIAARNAAATIAQTLDSLLAQGDADWEALVVDDGSSDATPQLVAARAERDTRVIALRGSGEDGVAAARNIGLQQARGRRVVFLDSDDWIAPAFLERMHAALDAAPGAAAAWCDYQRVMPDGVLAAVESDAQLADAPFDTFARTCAVAIHAVLLDRERVLRAGGFDAALRTCEDWDLWQRVARMGGAWVHVHEALAFYRISANSLSQDGARVLADGETVIRRGFDADPRLSAADDAHPRGASREGGMGPEIALAYFGLWCHAFDAARGHATPRARALLGALPGTGEHAPHVATTLLDAVSMGLLAAPAQLAARWAEFGPRITALIETLGAMWRDAAAARRVQYAFERMLLQRDDLAAPRRLALTLGLRVDLRAPATVTPPEGIDRFYARLCDGAQVLALVEAGTLGTFTARQWIELAAHRVGWPTVRRLAAPAVARATTPRALADAARSVRAAMRQPALRKAGWRALARTAAHDALLAAASPANGVGSHAEALRRLRQEAGIAHEAMAPRSGPADTGRRERVPVLAYRCIGDDGPPALARHRVATRAFAEQMAWLRQNGWHTLVSDELEAPRSFPGRPVMLTFDSGCHDFADTAWPLLRQYGFRAEVFIVTEPAPPPMEARTIAALAGEGVRFGTRMAGADGLSTRELAQALLHSRQCIARWTGRAPLALSSPIGEADERLRCLAAEYGYRIGVSTESTVAHDPMQLPRIEVRGDMALEEFAAVLEASR